MKIVLDTNVLVSGVLNPSGAAGSILNAILEENVTALVDDRILLEYHDVLHRDKFKIPTQHIQPLLGFFEHQGEFIVAGPVRGSVSDPGDVPFFEVAVAGDADYLVTGNLKHFPRKRFVVSPRAFIAVLSGRE